MSADKTDTLIDGLVEELDKVPCLSHPITALLPWVFFTLCYLSVVVLYLGVRHDFSEVIQDRVFLFENALVLFIAISAAISSAWLRVPDMRGHKWLIALPFSFFSVFVLWITLQIAEVGVTSLHFHWHDCFQEALLMGVLPAAAIIVSCRKGCTTHPYIMTFMNVLSASAMGYIGLRITCASNAIEHLAPHHIGPFILLGIIGGLLARPLFKW